MAYDVRFNVQQTGAETIDRLSAKMAVLKVQVAATGDEMAKTAKQIAAGTSGTFVADLDKLVVKQREEKAALDALTSSLEKATAGTRALGAAHTAAVPQVAAASAAIREFSGALPIRAVERFAVNVLGLGPILQKAFPILGMIAFAGILVDVGKKIYELYEKWDPVIRAEKAAKDALIEYGKSVDETKAKIRSLADAELARAIGKSAGAAHEASEISEDAVAVRRQQRLQQGLADRAQKDVDDTKAALAQPRSASMSSGSEQARLYGQLSQAESRLELANAQTTLLSNKAQELESASGVKLSESFDAQHGENVDRDNEKIRRENEAAQKAAEETKRLRTEQRSDEVNAISDPAARKLTEIRDRAKTYTTDANRESSLSSGLPDFVRTLREEQNKQAAKKIEEDQKQHKELLEAAEREMRENARPGEWQEEARKTAAFQNDLTKESASSLIRQATNRGASADKQIERNPDLDAAQKIAALHQQDLATAQEKYRVDRQAAADLIDLTATGTERAKAQHEADLKNEDELQKVKEQNLDRLAALEDQRIDQFRSLVGGLFEAVANRQPNAIPNFVKSQVLGQAQKLTENAAATYLWPTVSAIGKSAGLTGPLTAGTWLGGGSATNDPLKTTAAPALVDAAAKLVGAARALAGSGGGSRSSAAGGSAEGGADEGTFSGTGDNGDYAGESNSPASFPGSTLASSVSSTNSLAKLLGSGPNTFGSGLGSFFSGDAFSILSGGQANGYSTSDQIGAGVGTAAAIGTAGYGIYSGLKQGGVGGELKAAGSAAGLATSVVSNVAKLMGAAGPLLDAIPVVGSIVSLALPLIGGLFNGPQQRANAISSQLGEAQYNAPQALNVTQNSGGNFTDFDARGNIRTSDFSAIPTVRQGSTWEQTHGLFNGPPTFYSVPGGQTSQFGAVTAPPVINHNYAPGSISTIDATGFEALATRSGPAIGNIVAGQLQNSHGRLAAEVQRTAGV